MLLSVEPVVSDQVCENGLCGRLTSTQDNRATQSQANRICKQQHGHLLESYDVTPVSIARELMSSEERRNGEDDVWVNAFKERAHFTDWLFLAASQGNRNITFLFNNHQ